MDASESSTFPTPNFGPFSIEVYAFLEETWVECSNAGFSGNTCNTGKDPKGKGIVESRSDDANNDMHCLWESEAGTDDVVGKGGKAGLEKGSKNRRDPVSGGVHVISSISEGLDQENSDDEVLERPNDYEVREEVLGSLGRAFVWKMKIKSRRLLRKNVLQLPQKVIRDCLMAGHEEIILVDSDVGRNYHCVLHFSQRKYCIERFIYQGWTDFVRNRKLKKGDRVGFSLRVPSAEQLVVTVLKPKKSSN